MTDTAIETSDALRTAYRATFQDYADKLKTLQRIADVGTTASDAEIERALDAVETARTAHSSARDQLAKELMRCAASAPADQDQIRRTARLIWEFAGRPQGTAEHDWHKAERLVQAAAC